MISAPSGMVSTTRYTICICTGRLSSENCSASEPRSAARWRAAASASYVFSAAENSSRR